MKLRILVFDDDAEFRTMLQTALSSKGHEVTAFSDPTEFPFITERAAPVCQMSLVRHPDSR